MTTLENQTASRELAERQSSSDLLTLRQNSERFRLLVENSVDLIVEATRDGRVLYVSRYRHKAGSWRWLESAEPQVADSLVQIQPLGSPEGERHRSRDGCGQAAPDF